MLIERQTRNLLSLPDQRMSQDCAIFIFQLLLVKSIWRVDNVEMVLFFVHSNKVNFIILSHIRGQALLPSLNDLSLGPNLFFLSFAAHEELRHGRC